MEKQVRMFPFDALELPDGSFDREYSAGDFRDYFKKFIGNGVWNGIGKQLQVVHKSSLIVSVLSGACFIEGAGYTQEIETEIPLATANSSYGRYDLICAKLSYTDRNIKLYAKAGVPSASPKKPTLQRDSDAFELCLAEIYVGAGVTSISQANITDTRMNSEVCGWVSAMFETLDTTDLYLQYETYWKMIEKQINSNMAQFSSGYNLYGVAGGTGTYTANISGFVLSEGINVKIKFTNAHDGQHTLNINGLGAKPIVRADGTSFPIKANRIYNLIYDGVNFTLGGEGGWGNAQPSDVILGKTFTNDDGFQTGTLKAVNGKIEKFMVKNSTIMQGDFVQTETGFDFSGLEQLSYKKMEQEAKNVLCEYLCPSKVLVAYQLSNNDIYACIVEINSDGSTTQHASAEIYAGSDIYSIESIRVENGSKAFIFLSDSFYPIDVNLNTNTLTPLPHVLLARYINHTSILENGNLLITIANNKNISISVFNLSCQKEMGKGNKVLSLSNNITSSASCEIDEKNFISFIVSNDVLYYIKTSIGSGETMTFYELTTISLGSKDKAHKICDVHKIGGNFIVLYQDINSILKSFIIDTNGNIGQIFVISQTASCSSYVKDYGEDRIIFGVRNNKDAKKGKGIFSLTYNVKTIQNVSFKKILGYNNNEISSNLCLYMDNKGRDKNVFSVLYYSEKWGGSSSGYSVFKNNANDVVMPYKDSINGVAKSSGHSGELIDVYVPN